MINFLQYMPSTPSPLNVENNIKYLQFLSTFLMISHGASINKQCICTHVTEVRPKFVCADVPSLDLCYASVIYVALHIYI